jgi:hypothetical protein
MTDQLASTLSDMAASSKPIKVDSQGSGTQNIDMISSSTSLSEPRTSGVHPIRTHADLANNPIATSEVNDTGVTGDVRSGTGNLLPAEIEEKNLGPSYGGKTGKGKKNPIGKGSAHHKRGNWEQLELSDETPEAPYQSEPRV